MTIIIQGNVCCNIYKVKENEDRPSIETERESPRLSTEFWIKNFNFLLGDVINWNMTSESCVIIFHTHMKTSQQHKPKI